MTRAELLMQAEVRAQEALAKQQRQLAKIQAAQRAEERKARDKRRYQVGALADEAGLCGLDDSTLTRLFATLTPMAHTPGEPCGESHCSNTSMSADIREAGTNGTRA